MNSFLAVVTEIIMIRVRIKPSVNTVLGITTRRHYSLSLRVTTVGCCSAAQSVDCRTRSFKPPAAAISFTPHCLCLSEDINSKTKPSIVKECYISDEETIHVPDYKRNEKRYCITMSSYGSMISQTLRLIDLLK